MDRDQAIHKPLVVFWMPGDGLGKLTRALAIARHLRARCLIYASARDPYLEVARRERVAEIRRCCLGAIEDFASMNPAVVITDAQPHGGEQKIAEIPTRHVFIARRVKGEQPVSVGFDAVIDPHERYILIRGKQEWSLERGREILGDDEPVLAFHSGPAGCYQAERSYIFGEAAKIARDLNKRLVCLTPEEYYPVCELLPAAGHVVCAAGYNAFAETQAWGGPTTYLPMGRMYDDQHARLGEKPKWFNGAKKAAEIIGGLIDGILVA